MNRKLIALAALPLAALASSFVVPAPVDALPREIKLRRFEIPCHEKLNEILVEDLDGDGKRDLLLLLGRELRVHFQRESGTFEAEPDQRFKIDPRAVIMDVGSVLDPKTKQVAFIREDGVYAYPLVPAETPEKKPYYELRAKKLFAGETLLRRPSDDEVRRKEFLRDVDGDGIVDVFVPERQGFGVYRGLGGGKFSVRQPLLAPPTAVVGIGNDQLSSQLMASYYFANPTIADWDADGRPEVVVSQDQWLSVYFVNKEGAITERPVQVYEIPGQKNFSLDAEKPFELDFTMPLVLRDLNGDGRVDAALTHVGTGSTRVFLNSSVPADAFKTPARVVRAKGITPLAFFVDADGDGRADMILPRMDKIGIWSILKAVVTRSVPVEAQFFYQRAEGATYPEEPDFQRNFEIPIAIHSGGGGLDVGTSVIVSIDGDFDGDGSKDLLNRTEADKLAIYSGLAARGGLTEKPAHEFAIENTDEAKFVHPVVDDLNGDGRADVVLRYIAWERKNDRVSVFLSQ
jgi:hypothetical protein